MIPRRKHHRSTVPEWFITWGDLMSLLLCFFILLQVFSELKNDDEHVRVLGVTPEALARTGGLVPWPVEIEQLRLLIELPEWDSAGEAAGGARRSNDSVAADPLHIARIDEGLRFTVGGTLAFEWESADVSPDMRVELRKLGAALAGRKNRIVIRGHAENKNLSPASPWRDLHELSYARAREVLAVLIEGGIEERYCRIEAAGRWEPVASENGGAARSAINRRVDIIVTDEVVEDVPAASEEVQQ